MKQVQVRMYRPNGLGDCFLLSFPKASGWAHMLIDCGVLFGTEGGSERMRQLARNIMDTTHGKLDLLVVTHEHWDHLCGFVYAVDIFKDLKIDKVWLAWTENPDDQLAVELREQKTKALKTLNAVRQRLRLSIRPSSQATLKALNNLSLFDGDSNEDSSVVSGSNAASAMQWARAESGGKVSFLYPGKQPSGEEFLTIPGAEKIRVFVLGPPKNVALKKSNPSRRTPEVYHLAGDNDLGFLAALLEGDTLDSGHPFDSSFEQRADKVKSTAEGFFSEHYYADEAWRQIDDDWLGAAEQLALKLDSHTNNTSLVLAIELIESGRVLLFPGDAQVGSWLSWHDLNWEVKDPGGKPLTTENLLSRTVLYKVGHHGSHNATLADKGLEMMTHPELIAMIPVDERQAREDKKWNMPFPQLLTALQSQTNGQVIRTDTGVPPGWSKKIARRYEETDDYIDYFIDL